MPNNDYILRIDAIFALCGNCEMIEACGMTGDLCDDMKRIEAIHAADVEPVRYGRWIDENPASSMDPRMRCSVCGHVDLPLAKWRFCPMCGAKMVEEEGHE